ncbi:hypothetical protein BGX27_001874 [Mortierella sp. AM989]|nr:hypothetical protein BGX27_001874 [Mortierella sp. AM989]
MPHSSFHLDRHHEKSINRADQSSSPVFRPIQPSVAPPADSYVPRAPLYHTAFAHIPESSFNSSNAPSRDETVSSSSRPMPSDLEMQTRSTQHGASNRGGAASGTNIQPSFTSSTSSRHRQRGDMGSNARREQNSDKSGSRRRMSDSTVAVAWESGRTGSPSSSISGNKSFGSRSTRSTTRDPARNSSSREQHSPELAPLPASRKRFSLVRRNLASLDNSDKKRHAADRRGHSVSWAAHHDNDLGTTISHRHPRYGMSLKVPYSGGFEGEYGPRKTGIPGRNGEEPETNLFNFVNIMVIMPENPKIRHVVSKLLKILAVMTLSYFLLMALYFAAEYQSTSHIQNFSILVVDLDHSMIGSQFLNFTQQNNALPGQVNWSIQSKYKDLNAVIEDIENGNYWGAMVVRANASSMLNRALSIPLPDYDPTKAFLFIYDGGRDPLAVKPYVVASMYTQFLGFTKFFNPAWITLVLNFADNNATMLTPLATAPQVLGTPIAFEELDIHPPTATIITSATSVAYIWIFLIAGGSTYLVAHVVQPIVRFASVKHTMLLLLVPLLGFLCSLSMTYTVLLRIFGVPFNSASQFMSLFMGMVLLQAAVASLVLFLIFLIPVTFIPMITITFVVMNVIAVFNPVELMPGFYRWVYAMPFLNAVQMARYVLMGSYNRMSYNVPILFAWIVIPITLLPFAITRQKRLMAEIMEIEEFERRQRHQKGYDFDKESSHRQYMEERDDEIAVKYVGDKAKKRGKRSKEVESRRSTRSRNYRDGDPSENNQYSQSGDDDPKTDLKHHRHDHRRISESDDDNRDNNSDYLDTDDDGGHRAAANTARLIQPLNPRTISSGAIPSAPPESQVFDTLNRSYIEMPKLNRHPYASELARSQTPDEVK